MPNPNNGQSSMLRRRPGIGGWALWANIVMPLYAALVVKLLWNWFISPVLHTESISYFQAIAIRLMFLVLVSRTDLLREMRDGMVTQCWDFLITANGAVAFDEFKKDQDDPAMTNVAFAAGRLFLLNSTALLVGWGAHAMS